MANIIRCILPDGVHRFKPFEVSDYRDFLLVRNDMSEKEEDEQTLILDELIADYFSEYPKAWQAYIFLKVFTSSIGKTKVPIEYECPVCGKKQKALFNLESKELKNPSISINENTNIVFNIQKEQYENTSDLVINSIKEVVQNNTIYPWESLSKELKEQVIESIDIETFEKIVSKLSPIFFKLRLKCCEDHTLIYDNILSIFKILVNPDEIFSFYQINHILVKSQYDLKSVMSMLPIERSIVLSLIEKDKKQ